MISRRMATLAELDSVLGVADLYMLLEIIAVDDHNKAVLKNADRH